MTKKEENKNSELPRGKITALMDVPYPRKIWDKIKNGDDVDFQELVKTGMVIAFITPYDDELESMQNHIMDWANRNKNVTVFMDLDADQKFLNRFLEINKNNGRIDYAGLNQLFEKICLYSSFLSEHQDEDHPSLISLKTRIITFHSGKQTAYYLIISSHPDLIDEERLKQLMDQTRQRFEENIEKIESNKKSSKPDKEIIPSGVFNLNIGVMKDSNIQLGTVNSNQKSDHSSK